MTEPDSHTRSGDHQHETKRGRRPGPTGPQPTVPSDDALEHGRRRALGIVAVEQV